MLSKTAPNLFRASLAAIVMALLFSTYSLASGAADTYKKRCSACHGANGAGDTMIGKNLKLRDLRSADVQKQTDAELVTLITNGKKVMPVFGKTLSASQIRDVAAYVRSIAKKD